jgi:hypothetical protein
MAVYVRTPNGESVNVTHLVARGDRARAWNGYLAGAAVLLFIALIWSCTRPAPVAPPCPASGVMQLDPTTVRARATESVEI